MQEVDRKFWQQQEVDKIQTMKQERKLALQHRDRLKRMEVDKNAYLSKLKSQRFSSYKVTIPHTHPTAYSFQKYADFFFCIFIFRINWNSLKKN